MKIIPHTINSFKIAEIVDKEIILDGADSALELIGNLYFLNYEIIILYKNNLPATLYELSNGLAGEILQKFSNYRMKLAVVGDFNLHSNQHFKDFIYECNKGNLICFMPSLETAIEHLTRK